MHLPLQQSPEVIADRFLIAPQSGGTAERLILDPGDRQDQLEWGHQDHPDEIAQSLGGKNSEQKVTSTRMSLENAAALTPPPRPEKPAGRPSWLERGP